MQSPTTVVHSATDPLAGNPAPTSELEPAPSKAAIAGHPIHPALVPFPVALLFLVAVTDIVYATTESLFWASVSYYLLWAGLVGAGVAAIFGLIDFIGVPRVRTLRAGWAHLLLNLSIVVLSVANLVLRWGNSIENVLPSGTILSIIASILLLLSGWYGGEMVYRYKVGVSHHHK